MNMFYSYTSAGMQFFIFQERIHFLTNPVNLITHKNTQNIYDINSFTKRCICAHEQ